MAENTTIEEIEETRVPLDVMMENLEKCVEKMERADISLEESFETFKEGMELVKKCNAGIDKVEKEVMVLSDDGRLNPMD